MGMAVTCFVWRRSGNVSDELGVEDAVWVDPEDALAIDHLTN